MTGNYEYLQKETIMIKVILKAMRVLEVISERGGEAVRLSELSQALGENPSTCAGIVRTLTNAGYLQKDPVRGYRLGVMSASLLHGDLYDAELLGMARVCMPELAAKEKLYLSLAVLRGKVRHSVLEVDARGAAVMQYSPNPNVFHSATGLMLAAHVSAPELDALMELYTLPRRFRSGEEFRQALYIIRAQGFCELARPGGVMAIAVPIPQEPVRASLGCMLRPEENRTPYEVLPILLDGAGQMARWPPENEQDMLT